MVMPIYDDNPFTQPIKPVVTWCLIAINLGVFLYETGATQLALERMIDTFSLTPAALVGDMRARGWVPAFVTLITYQFFHADIGHFLGNMIFLWVFGDDIERALGRLRFLAFYLLCGVVGGLVFVANTPHSKIELIGASGAIAGDRRRLCDAAPLRQDHGAVLDHSAADQRLLGDRPVRHAAVVESGLGVEERGRLLVPFRWHAGRRRPVPADEAAAVMLFQCLQPVPDTVVRIGPSAAAIARGRRAWTR